MTLTNAPADQLEAARAAIATVKGLKVPHLQIYTSYDSRKQLVRVKLYGVGTVPPGKMSKLHKLGFTTMMHRYNSQSSMVGYF